MFAVPAEFMFLALFAALVLHFLLRLLLRHEPVKRLRHGSRLWENKHAMI